ncbi:efflux RND transporter periplasmic adaptor subunit [Thalassolituus maritimus]|uniref:Efflux RND transporter periplasmic adaptor subunit n=1 Tax=Thalassolituus maritimus TaxID=484498 RepID=A0ABP9ZYG3_9GAMM
MNEKKKNLALIGVSILIILAAFAAWKVIQDTAPKPGKKERTEVARLVDAVALQRAVSRPEWQTGGTVIASDSVTLVAQVSGRVERVESSAVPGALLKKGTLLAQLEKGDYELALKQAQASLTQAQAALAIEEGQVSLAQEEYALSGTQLSATDRALVLREPQLQVAKADLASAEAAVQQARINLSRTEIRMPFDGRLSSRAMSPGSYASAGSELFSAVATSEFWIEAKLPRSFLPLLDRDHSVVVSHAAWGGKTRKADILNVLPGVDSGDRQARVVLSLASPLDPAFGPVVLVNDYVSLTLSGLEFKDAYRVPRERVSDDGTVWVVNSNQLQKREPTSLYMGRDYVWFADGFEESDRLLASQVDAAVTGMRVRIAGDEE